MNKILLAFFILVNVVSIFGVQMKWHKNFTIPQAPTAPFSWDNCGKFYFFFKFIFTF